VARVGNSGEREKEEPRVMSDFLASIKGWMEIPGAENRVL
jgi:hypothetical protein